MPTTPPPIAMPTMAPVDSPDFVASELAFGDGPPDVEAGTSVAVDFVEGVEVETEAEVYVVRAVIVLSFSAAIVGKDPVGTTSQDESEVGHAGGEFDGVYAALEVLAGSAL